MKNALKFTLVISIVLVMLNIHIAVFATNVADIIDDTITKEETIPDEDLTKINSSDVQNTRRRTRYAK